MKIRALQRRADALAEKAQDHRRASRAHAERSLSIVRRRVGSPAGLALSFSLGFMAGSGGAGRGNRRLPKTERRAIGEEQGMLHRLIRGPLGEAVLKLASAVVASSVMKYIQAGRHDSERAAQPAADGVSVHP